MEKTIFEIEKVDVNQLPELQGLKEKQLKIVKENPYVEIVDNTTYNEAKKARTALKSARTDIEKQDRLIASKIKAFREMTMDATKSLIAITQPHEDKQQEEVKRYEQEKEQERLEKQRIEEERKATIKKKIDSVIETATHRINQLTFDMIETLRVDFEQNLYKIDITEFEEFELDFNEKIRGVKQLFEQKANNLKEAEAQRLEKEQLKAEREKLEAEKREQEERLRAEREAIEKKQREEQEKLETERKKLEEEKQALAKAEAERKAKEEAEQRAKEEAERKAKEQKEAEERAKAEAERLEALKPEKQKVLEWAKDLFIHGAPNVEDKALAKEIEAFANIQNQGVKDFIKHIENFK
ncbi:hypothetical protein [Riemerella columbina]|uniref:hypothetical protein n=1 Tax=Riemerella columbina TaxID=103810 RepID=UPI000361ABF0|nr:hypothetical protein [Riemerella columbina]